MDRTLKLANIGAVPVVVGLIALVVGFVRYQRRRRRYETS